MGNTQLRGDIRTQQGTEQKLREITRGGREYPELISELAEEIAGYLFSPDRLRDIVIRVSTTKRKVSRFETFAVPVLDTPNSPTLLVERQKDRVELLIINPVGSGGTIFIGSKSVKSTGGDQGIPIPAGNSFTLDTTFDAVYAIPTAGAGTVTVNCFDAVE
jgi:hypothetical protein